MLTKLKYLLLCASFVLTTTTQAVNLNTQDTISYNIQTWQTKNQAHVYFIPTQKLPIVDIEVLVAAGSSRDGNQPGIANFTNALIGENSKLKNADAIAETFDNADALFNKSVYRDYSQFTLRTVTNPSQMQPVIANFRQLFSSPVFSGSSFTRIQKQILEDILLQGQDPSGVADNTLFTALYGNYPYAHNPLGTAENIKAYTPKDILAFYQQYYVGNNITVAIVGNLSQEQAKNIAEQLVGALPQGQAAPMLASPATPKPSQINVAFPTPQTNIRVAKLGVDIHSPDLPALTIANTIFGGGIISQGQLVSILFKEVRDKRGLSYDINSAFLVMQNTGPFIIAGQTKNSTTDETIQLILKQLKLYYQQGPTPQEIDAAKTDIIGGFPLHFDSNSNIADNLSIIGFYRLPLDYFNTYQSNIAKVTNDEVLKAIRNYMAPSQMLVVSVGANKNNAASNSKT